jgi:hypothetical protein
MRVYVDDATRAADFCNGFWHGRPGLEMVGTNT